MSLDKTLTSEQVLYKAHQLELGLKIQPKRLNEHNKEVERYRFNIGKARYIIALEPYSCVYLLKATEFDSWQVLYKGPNVEKMFKEIKKLLEA